MAGKRQLALPGLPPARPPATARLKLARRDYSEAEFANALERNGFLPHCDNPRYVDPTGPTGERVFDAVIRRHPLRVARRATLAKLIRARDDQGAR